MNQSVYYLERHFFPESFFSDNCEIFLGTLLNDKGAFCVNILNSVNSDEQNYKCPYSAEQFRPHIYKVKTGIETLPYFYMFQLTMPEPDVSPLCKRVYFCHDEVYGHRYYYTIEKTVNNTWMLCEWKRNGMHINHGDCTEDLEFELQRIEDLFIDDMYVQNRNDNS